MNFWYAPVDESSLQVTPRLPVELIAAVAAPWRSTTELEAIKAKAVKKSNYDMADSAQRVLLARKKQEADNAVRTLRERQSLRELQQGFTAQEAFATVGSIWDMHLDQLRGEASDAVRALQEKHEEALAKLRVEQVARARQRGIRPERRNKELQNLRRSESVLVKEQDFYSAFRVKAHADVLAAAEASDAYKDWLLRCHGEQEKLLTRQHREVEILCGRMDGRIRNVELARDRDLDKLKLKLKVATEQQRHDFVKERQYLQAALGGCLLNTRTTRTGRGVADAIPTLARVAPARQQPAEVGAASATERRADSEATSGGLQQGSGYLGPVASEESPPRHWPSEGQVAEAPGVRFAPTPPREAWSAASEKGSGWAGGSGSERVGSGRSSGRWEGSGNSGSVRGSSRPSTSSGFSLGSSGRGGLDDVRPQWRTAGGRPVSRLTDGRAMAGGEGAPASSAAVASGTTADGSGSSALTEEALRAMNQAMGAPPPEAPRDSQQTSSFKSNMPYAGGMSARNVSQPIAPVNLTIHG